MYDILEPLVKNPEKSPKIEVKLLHGKMVTVKNKKVFKQQFRPAL